MGVARECVAIAQARQHWQLQVENQQPDCAGGAHTNNRSCVAALPGGGQQRQATQYSPAKPCQRRSAAAGVQHRDQCKYYCEKVDGKCAQWPGAIGRLQFGLLP